MTPSVFHHPMSSVPTIAVEFYVVDVKTTTVLFLEAPDAYVASLAPISLG